MPSPSLVAASCRLHCFKGQIQSSVLQHRLYCLCLCPWQRLDQLESDHCCQEVAIHLAQTLFWLSSKHPFMHDHGDGEPAVSFHPSCFLPLQCWYRKHLVRLRIITGGQTYLLEKWPVWCLLCLMFRLILQGDVGLPGPAGPPPSTGELEFMGFPKGKKGSKVVNI